jgi:thymidylate synthase
MSHIINSSPPIPTGYLTTTSTMPELATVSINNEMNYLNVLKEVLETGEERETRNATTISKFGMRMEFDIRQHFPLLTTKRVFWKGVLTELLWFIKGNTDAKLLSSIGNKIWDGNTSREFLDKSGLTEYEIGDCGPIYGFQWRYFGAKYQGPIEKYITDIPSSETITSESSIKFPEKLEFYQENGFDQLGEIIRLLKEDKHSRRIFMSGWNPLHMSEMVLPPCHVSYQFYVNKDDELSCQMYQRSGDLFLGVPFNIASTACLTYLLAHHCGLKPGKVIICLGDAHIYKAHIEQVREQLSREIKEMPTMVIKEKRENINDYVFEDFEIIGYNPHPTIKADMIA